MHEIESQIKHKKNRRTISHAPYIMYSRALPENRKTLSCVSLSMFEFDTHVQIRAEVNEFFVLVSDLDYRMPQNSICWPHCNSRSRVSDLENRTI